ncbi:DUF1178 family protein [Hyphomonas sp. FCG-A18]|uniref:DUF1178 family protein n=1 Tax=Hyphomonas sp. FCG-A18 TaxID=3080019 RepID=UPI002B297040|nr:DUF1178 family protein [Hyphomonas sp. FCG-A18]
MIKYALICQDCEAEFEGWFASSSAFDDQKDRGLLSCAACDGSNVAKAIMAPAVSGTKKSGPPDPQKVFGKLAAKARQHVADNFDYVGDSFATEARAMHYGEIENKPIWGETTPEERAELKEEGVPAEPLPPAFVPAKPRDDEKLN